MKKVHYTIMACFFFGMAQAQVGIGTVTPNATLDIKAANQAAPANNDGILIPKIDEFSLTPPTVAQDGMLVYATGTGAPSKGFYYWDNATSSWLLLNNGSTTDADWFEEGTTNFPNTITDNIYTNGNVAIGKTMAQYALDIADTLNGRGVNVSLTGTSVVDSYGGYFKVNRPVDGQAYGLYIDVSGAVKMNTVQNGLYTRLVQSGGSTNVGVQNSLLGTGTGNQLGIYNTLWGNSDGDQYGVSNVITNSGSGQHIGIENSLYGAGTGGKYGVNTYIEPTAGGIHYGIFSNVLKTGSYAGYFLGNVAIGTDAANIYNLPASRGTVNQVMQTDGSGNVSWASPSSIGSWSLSGNTGTNPATQFLGTMDSVSVAIRIKNIEKWRFTTLGQLEFLNNNDNILIGLNAGNTAEASSGGHTFVGNGAGQNVGTFSSWNTYIGLEAGENTTSGSVNTYVGTFAGKATTTGGANTYIGKEAGASTTTGGGNIAIGQKSGTVNSTGDFNVYIGQLLGDSSDGNNNVLVGNRTHIGNATGSNNNVIIGFKGGEGQTDGANNIMIGGNELRFPNLAGSNSI